MSFLKINKLDLIQGKVITLEAFLFAMVIFIQSPIQYVWLLQDDYQYSLFMAIMTFLLSCRHFDFKSKQTPFTISLYILLIIFYMTGSYSIYGLIRVALLYSVVFINPVFLKQVVKCFSVIFGTLLIPSIIEYLIVNVGGVYVAHVNMPSPYATIDTMYNVYPFHAESWKSRFAFGRFFAFFDEPGVVGTFATFLLYCSGYRMKRWYNWPIITAGILSFSLFFFLATAAYLLLFYKSVKSRFLLLGAIIIFCVVFDVQNNEVVNETIIERLQYDEEKGFTGNNRAAGNFDEFYDNFKHTSDVWLGLGRGAKQIYDDQGATYKDRILEYGYLGFGSYLLLMLLYGYVNYTNRKRAFITATFVYIVGLWQRPFIDFQTYMVLYLCIFTCFDDYESNGITIKNCKKDD